MNPAPLHGFSLRPVRCGGGFYVIHNDAWGEAVWGLGADEQQATEIMRALVLATYSKLRPDA